MTNSSNNYLGKLPPTERRNDVRQRSKHLNGRASGSFRKVTIVRADETLLVEGDGIEVECKDGQVFVRNGTVTLSGGARLIDRPLPDRRIHVGMRMDDGTIYAGTSPDTGKPMYTTDDAPLTCAFNEAVKYAADLHAHGHNDWRVPSKDELNQLFHDSWMIGGFNTTGEGSEEFYWSSTPTAFGSNSVWAQRFSNGYQHKCHAGDRGKRSLRCVRG